ncbi:MAG: hypothetical protein KY396_08130 [Actinobacteria bacterium]|nr:hypothetical protein [Actinomycetota bacterium]
MRQRDELAAELQLQFATELSANPMFQMLFFANATDERPPDATFDGSAIPVWWEQLRDEYGDWYCAFNKKWLEPLRRAARAHLEQGGAARLLSGLQIRLMAAEARECAEGWSRVVLAEQTRREARADRVAARAHRRAEALVDREQGFSVMAQAFVRYAAAEKARRDVAIGQMPRTGSRIRERRRRTVRATPRRARAPGSCSDDGSEPPRARASLGGAR